MTEERKKLAIERGRRLKKALKRRGLTQVELAKQSYLSLSTIRQICSGFRMLQTDQAYKLAEILQIRSEYLLCIDEDVTEEEKARRLVSEAVESAVFQAKYLVQWVKEVCEKIGFKLQGVYANDAEVNPDFMYRIKISELQQIEFPSGVIESWLDECQTYAAFTLDLLIKQKLAEEGKSDEV